MKAARKPGAPSWSLDDNININARGVRSGLMPPTGGRLVERRPEVKMSAGC